MKISKVILYDEPTVAEIKIEEIKQFIIDTFQIKVEINDNFFERLENETFEKIASPDGQAAVSRSWALA